MNNIKVINEKCVGCTLCVKACPFSAISMQEKKAVIDLDKCTLCGACVEACKFNAIEIKRTSKQTENIQDYKGVWVFGEQKKGMIQPVVFELLGKARELAHKLHTDVSCVVLGHNIKVSAQHLIYQGADTVYLVDSPNSNTFLDEPYSKILTHLIRKYRPEILLSGATFIGRALVSRVAVKTPYRPYC